MNHIFLEKFPQCAGSEQVCRTLTFTNIYLVQYDTTPHHMHLSYAPLLVSIQELEVMRDSPTQWCCSFSSRGNYTVHT